MATQTATATYTSPTSTSPHTITSTPLPSLSSSSPPSTSDRTAYLDGLSASIIQLQANVNTFLTQKMEEDKAAAEKEGKASKVDDEKEEENYGEEVVEAD